MSQGGGGGYQGGMGYGRPMGGMGYGGSQVRGPSPYGGFGLQKNMAQPEYGQMGNPVIQVPPTNPGLPPGIAPPQNTPHGGYSANNPYTGQQTNTDPLTGGVGYGSDPMGNPQYNGATGPQDGGGGGAYAGANKIGYGDAGGNQIGQPSGPGTFFGNQNGPRAYDSGAFVPGYGQFGAYGPRPPGGFQGSVRNGQNFIGNTLYQNEGLNQGSDGNMMNFINYMNRYR